MSIDLDSDLTAMALVVDRSGSMWNVAEDTKGSVKQFITSQQAEKGSASFTLAQFDHEYEVIHDCVDLQKVDASAFADQYQPRGSTALLDAIGRTTIELSNRIEAMEASKSPERVVVAIITDGYENSSHEFTIHQINELLSAKQNLGWDFIFLGAGLDAIDVAASYGLSKDKSAYYNSGNVREAVDTIGQQVLNARKGEAVEFTEEQRKNLEETPPSGGQTTPSEGKSNSPKAQANAAPAA